MFWRTAFQLGDHTVKHEILTFLRAAPLLLSAALVSGCATPTDAGDTGSVVDRVKSDKTIRLGIRTDAPPFSSVVGDRPQGFSVDLCGLVAAAMSEMAAVEGMKGTLVSVDTQGRFDALQSGEIDILCGATTATLSRREIVSFSIPTFSTGVGAVARADASAAFLKAIDPAGSSGDAGGGALNGRTIAVRAGTTAEDWAAETAYLKPHNVTIVEVADHNDGLDQVANGTVDAYFADKAIILGNLRSRSDGESFALSRTTFTAEPYALALPRGDEDLRLLVDRALSALYRSGAVLDVYRQHFGEPDANVALFYRTVALPK